MENINIYNLHTQVNLIADYLEKTARLLKKGKSESLTKQHMRDIIATALVSVEECSDILMKPRNALIPIEAGNEANSLFDELVKVDDDIGTVQYMIAHDDIESADRLLREIKGRI